MIYAEHLENLKAIAKVIGEQGEEMSQSTAALYLQVLEMCLKMEKFLDNDGGIQRC